MFIERALTVIGHSASVRKGDDFWPYSATFTLSNDIDVVLGF